MGRKKARIRYLVLGIICSAYAFLALIGIIWMLSRQPISEQNTAEYTATVRYVRHINDQEDGPAVIYTEEYGDKITVNYFCDLADMRRLYSLSDGDEITFRINNAAIKSLLEERIFDYLNDTEIIYGEDFDTSGFKKVDYKKRPIPMGYIIAKDILPVGCCMRCV